MPQRAIRFRTTTPVPARAPVDTVALMARFEAIRAELHVPTEFPPDVLAEAAAAVAALVLPERDETAVPFVTIDPVGSMDLDQALHIEREGDGYRVRYAIADVPAFVLPGGAVDTEARQRVETIYAPDQRTPLHPPVIGEDAGSLLPDQVRPAFVWDLRLDAAGDEHGAEVYLAQVRSRARLDYRGVQQSLDDGTADEVLVLLKEVGQLRITLEAARGGASLPLPEQEVTQGPDGDYVLGFRPPVAAEDWNAQISLMTGMAAAQMMLRGKVGLLRTMPPPDQGAVARFRRQAKALGVDWPPSERYGDFIRGLNLADPRQLALVHEATALFRGAGYTAFDGTLPQQQVHAAVAAPYAHVTAPLRRLVDRFGLVVCAALTAGDPVPDWARASLAALPEVMKTGDQRAKAVERACTDAVEAAVLASRVGETFPADVIDVDPKRSRVTVQLTDPAILGTARGESALGRSVQVRIDTADVATGKVEMSIV
ncbi:RNB domain-containing ribonuclease [Lapillicoccus sp.]|uniref:RNB domain-containing ribonuclease n=1 Tax=Lapillicoccus sp. TaxID=1909287 RepID=UPI003266A1FC